MNTIIPWLEHLNVLMPPRDIALVGAGNGKGIWAQWLVHEASKSRVTFIEAEPLQYSTLQRTLDLLGERAQHCEIRNTVVAAQQGTVSFFVANSQQESGLLEPRSLLSLWPNLQTEEVKELSAITLDALLGDLSEDAEQPMGEGHWLVIDCLPAGTLLRASSKLDLVDVVIARVLLGEMHAMPEGTSFEEVAEFLQQKGMVQIAVEATRHPGIGYALFVRDARADLHAQLQTHHSECQKLRLNGEEQAKLLQEFQAQVGQLTQTKAAAEKRSQELALQLEQLGQALEKQSRLAQERLSQTEQLTQAKLIVETQSQERVQQLEQLGKARDEQAKLAQERHAQIEQLTQAKAAAEKQSQERAQQLEQLTKARDEQAKLAQERHAQIEQLTQAKAAAEKQLQERAQQLEQLTKARDEQAKLAQERHAQIEPLTQAKAAAEKQSQERVQQLEQLTKAHDEQAKLAQERLAQTEQLTQAKAAAEKQSQERAQQLEQLTKARDEQAKLAQECLVQTEQLTQAKAAAEKQSQERAQQLEQLTKARDEQAKLAQERLAQTEQLTQAKAAAEKQSQERAQQLEQLTKARDEQAKLAQERHAQIEQLTQAKAAAEKQSQDRAQQLEQLTKARDEQAKLAQERHAQIEQLTQAKAAAEKQSQDRAQQLEQVSKAREEQMLLARGRLEQIEQSALAKAALEQQLKERMVLLEQLMKVHDEQIELAQERRAQIKDLTQSKVVAENLAQERAQQLTIFREMHAEQLKSKNSFPLISNQPPIKTIKKNIFILIRYSVLLETAKDYWRIGRTEFSSYREVLFSEERLKTREHLFSKICLPSLQNIYKENINSEESVNFKAIILSSSDLPEDSKIFLENVKKENDFIELAYTSEKSGGVSKGFEEYLSVISPDEYCATVRLDDDDALSLDWFYKIKEYIKPEFEDYVISLCGGYALMVDEDLNIQSIADFKMRFGALGLSYIAKGGSKYNIYNCGAHYKTDEKNPTILYSDGKYILRTYSKTNDSGDKFPESGIIKNDDCKNVLIDNYGINF